MGKRFRIFFAWYDFWIGAYWSREGSTLFICLLPMVVMAIYIERRATVPPGAEGGNHGD